MQCHVTSSSTVIAYASTNQLMVQLRYSIDRSILVRVPLPCTILASSRVTDARLVTSDLDSWELGLPDYHTRTFVLVHIHTSTSKQ